MVSVPELSDPLRLSLARELEKVARKEKSGIWLTVAKALTNSRSRRAEVNVHKISRHTSEGDIVVVPGKVLGSGRLAHPVSVAAYNFTAGARQAVESAGGKALSIKELFEQNRKGSGIKIIS